MAYIGSSAAVTPVAFSGVNAQSFNGDGSTVAFTLNRPVSSVAAIEVVVNNVQQSPYDGSYSVSNTTLTFSAAPSTGTGNIYVVYRDFPVGSITDPNAVAKTGDTMTGNLIVNANVGIGTSSPTRKLTIDGTGAFSSTTAPSIRFNDTASSRFGIVDFDSSQNLNLWASTDTSAVRFITNTGAGTERARFTSDGYLRMASGSGGIQFNGDTAATNALDDYEEGTWTPDISGITGAVYSYQLGTYTKIGNMVYCFWDLQLSSFGGSFNARIYGLPYTVSGSQAGYSVLQVRDSSMFNSIYSDGQLKGFAQQAANYIYFQVDRSGTAGFGTGSSSIPTLSTGRCTGYVMYQAAT